MTTLTEFLLARITEDEADPWRGAELIGSDRVIGRDEERALLADEKAWESRALAECEAKRRIVEEFAKHDQRNSLEEQAWQAWHLILRSLATVYSDHPDYDSTWAPF